MSYEWAVRCEQSGEVWDPEDSEGTEAGAHLWASPERNNCWIGPPHAHTVVRRPLPPDWEAVATYLPLSTEESDA